MDIFEYNGMARQIAMGSFTLAMGVTLLLTGAWLWRFCETHGGVGGQYGGLHLLGGIAGVVVGVFAIMAGLFQIYFGLEFCSPVERWCN